jgi:hypothetical protein
MNEVITDYAPTVTNEHDPVEVVEDEEPAEEESRMPERIRNPAVKVTIVRRRRIVGDHWRAFLIVVVVYYRRVRLGLVFSIRIGATRQNGQPELSCEILKCFQCLFFSHRQLFRICCSCHSVLQLADNIGCDRVISDPPVSWRDSDRSQHILSLSLACRRS